MNNKEIRKHLGVHPKAWRRVLSDETASLSMKRYDKFNRWLIRKEKSEANAVIWDGQYLVFSGGRGLIHKGGKP